jgi:two-component system, OmpR family, response regulator
MSDGKIIIMTNQKSELLRYKILVVDDDPKIRQKLATFLRMHFADILEAEDATSMRKIIKNDSKIDLVFLDVEMPGETGFEIVRNPGVPLPPTIFLTAKSEVQDVLTGLELGVDEYFKKPFDPQELLNRTKTILKKTYGDRNSERDSTARFSIDSKKKELKKNNQVITLTSEQWRLLDLFLSYPNKVLNNKQILAFLGEDIEEADDPQIDSQVALLREKIEDDSTLPEIIKTVWGIGYIFSMDLNE